MPPVTGIQTPAVQTREPSTTTATPAAPQPEGRGRRNSGAAGGMPNGPGGRAPQRGGDGPRKAGGDPTDALMKTMEQTNLAQAKMQVMQQQMVTEGSQRSIQMEANRQMTETAKQASKDMGDANKKPS
jgi:hypothetical protein